MDLATSVVPEAKEVATVKKKERDSEKGDKKNVSTFP